MNLFKKSTAAVALVTLVSSVFTTGVSAYSTSEIEAANTLAQAGVIVDQSANPAAYNLDQNVLRQEIAAVARGIAGLDKKTTCDGVFTDVSATTPNTWACYSVEALADAGLIAKNAQFRPEANISKAEAVGMVVKAAFGDAYAYDASKGTTWQEQVVAFAVANGIVSNFTNYDTAATRGFVFEAGANAMSSTEDEEMDDIICTLLGTCGTEEDNTSEEDDNTTVTTPVVTGGNVEVSLNPASAVNGTQIPNNGTVRFAKVDFTAGSQDVSVNTVEVKSLGLASVPTGTRVFFEKNGKRLSGKAAFSSDRTAVVSFAPALVVKAGSTETLDLYVELATTAGNDFQFSGTITSSSANNNNGSFTTASLRTATYTVVTAEFKKAGSNNSYNQSSDFVELGRFTVENKKPSGVSETRDVTFNNITLRQLGTGNLSDLSELHIERNGVKVSTEVIVDAKDVTFILNDTIKDASTATYYVKAKVVSVENNGGDTYKFSLRNTSDVSSTENLNGFRTTVTINSTTTAPTNELFQYTVTGADIMFERDSSVELSRNYAKGTNNVTLMKGKITSKTAVTLEDVTLTYNSTLSGSNANASSLFDTVYLKIGSSVMTWSATATGAAEFLGLATVNGSADVELYAKLKDSAPADTVKFADLRLSSFAKKEYVSNQNDVTSSVGAISAVSVSVDSTTLSVTRVDGLGNTTIATGSKAVTLNTLKLAVTQWNPVSISNATYTVTNSINSQQLDNVFVTLYVDGVAVKTETVKGATVSFSNLSKTVNAAGSNLEVRADLSDAFTTGNLTVTLTSLDIVDTLTSATVNLGTVPTSAVFTVNQAVGTLSSSDANPKASLLLAGDKDQKVLAFRVKASNDSVKLRDLAFTGSNLDKLSNFRVVSSSNEVVASATSNTATGVTFTNINTTDSVAMDQTKTYYLVADVNTNVNAAAFDVNLALAGSNIRSTNGSTIAMVGANVTWNTHLVNEDKAVVAKATNSSKNLTTSALRFTVTASGKDSVTLTGATFTNLLSGYTTGSGKLVVYKDSISSGNKLGETSVGTVSGAVTFNANNTVDNGSTNTYIVVLEGVVVDGGSNSQDWSVSLSNVFFDGIWADSYDNLGDFPITETK